MRAWWPSPRLPGPRACARSRLRPPWSEDLLAHRGRHHPEIRPAPARAGTPRQECARGGRALDCLVRALALDPDFGRRGVKICLLTVGATIPKFALHPRAQELRDRNARVVAEPSIAWSARLRSIPTSAAVE